MNTINFDTLKAAKSLQDAGFEAPQAEAVVGMVTHALSEGLASKEDVRDLQSSIDTNVRDLQSSIKALDVRIDALDVKIDALDSKIDSSVAALDSKIDSSVAALNSKIDSSVAALDSKIDSGVAALNVKIDALDVKIDNGLKNVIQKLTILLGGIVIGSITLLGVLSRVFPVLPAP